jgi:2-oxoisovalerate dehydrogenase E1 component beta subunit
MADARATPTAPGNRASRGATIADGINRALDEALTEDPRVMLIGEDIGVLGGVFRITDGLQAKHGADRVVDSPLAEAGLVGTAIGLALAGWRPVVEIQFDGFVFPALNQVCTHLARMPQRMDEPGLMPVVIRVPCGGRIRATELHSESPEAYFAHTPDLRVVAASTPDTARGLLKAAIRSQDPVVFLEPKRLYRRERVGLEDEVSDVSLDRARVLREGDDAMIVTYGPLVDVALSAHDRLAEAGRSVAVLDLVTLAPLDEMTLFDLARRSGRVVVASEGIARCSVSSHVVSRLATECFSQLRAAPRLVTAPDHPYPRADQEDAYLPSVQDVVNAVTEVMR